MWFYVFMTFVGCFLLAVLYSVIQFSILRLQLENVSNRYTFITGCDTGFGNLLARQLDSRGVPVFAACLTTKGAKELAEVTSSRLQTLIIDVTDKDSIENAVKFVKSKLPSDKELWGVVNNAGVMPNYCPLEMVSLEDFENVCQVNLFGTIGVTLAFLPLIRKSRGRIVNMCSAVANCAYPGVTNYCISKAGAKVFTTCLRRELFNSGVSTHSIEPGGFATHITSCDRLVQIFRHAYESSPADVQKFYGGNISKYFMNGFDHHSKYVSERRDWVVDAMAHALLAKHPKRSYVVGTDAHLFFTPLTYIPEWMADYVLGWARPYGELPKQMKDWAHKE